VVAHDPLNYRRTLMLDATCGTGFDLQVRAFTGAVTVVVSLRGRHPARLFMES